MVAFLLPTAAAVTDVLLRDLCVRHPIDEPSSMNVLATYDAVMFWFIIFVMGVHATVLLALLGMLSGREWAAQIVPLMLVLTMISIGNLLPPVFRKTCACLKEAPGKPRTAELA
jgi:hypothetical protein